MNDSHLWGLAVATYGIGDLVTTGFGLGVPGVVESHPVSEKVIDNAGMPGMVGVKIVTLSGFGAMYSMTPEEYRSGVPIGLGLLGTFIVALNGMTIATAMNQ